MTPEERQLISGLFDRMRSYGAPDKDREAEALIAQSVRANPDATYMLVQSVLVQEQALEATNSRVQELEDQLRAMEGGRPRGAAPAASSVVETGAVGAARSPDPACPRSARGQRLLPTRARSHALVAGRTRSPSRNSRPPAPSGGGFMKSALATAAGVAGGMVLADSLRNMLGGGAHASPSTLAGPREGADPKYQDESDNDPGTTDRPMSRQRSGLRQQRRRRRHRDLTALAPSRTSRERRSGMGGHAPALSAIFSAKA